MEKCHNLFEANNFTIICCFYFHALSFQFHKKAIYSKQKIIIFGAIFSLDAKYLGSMF